MLMRAALASSVFMFHSCGKSPNAEDQDHKKINLKEIMTSSSSDGLNLNQEQITYRGSTIIWNNQADPQKIAAMSKTSKQMRSAKARYVKHHREEISNLQDRIVSSKGLLQSLEAEARLDPSTIRERKRIAADWFQQQLSQHIRLKELTILQAQKAQNLFDAYCEAKIWESAIFGMFRYSDEEGLISSHYKKLPLPTQLCANYYQYNNLLDESRPACSRHTGQFQEDGKDYFDCLWEEGLLKTRFYKENYRSYLSEKPFINKGNEIKRWFSHGYMKEGLTGEKYAKFAIYLMNQQSIRLSSAVPLPVSSTEKRKYKDIFIPDGGEPSGRIDIHTPFEASPLMIIQAVEDCDVTTPREEIQFLPDSLASSPLCTGVKLLSRRAGRSTNLSEHIFSEPVGEETPDLTYVKAQPHFKDFFEAISPDFAVQISAANSQLNDVQNQLNAATQVSEKLLAELSDLMHSSAILASDQSVTKGFWVNSSLQIQKDDDDTISITFKMDDQLDLRYKACWSVSKNAQTTCLDPEHFEEMLISRAPNSNVLKLGFALGDPESFGFSPLSSEKEKVSGEPFSNIATRDLVNKTLVLNISHNKIDDYLQFYSGDIEFKSEDQTSFLRGAINLIED